MRSLSTQSKLVAKLVVMLVMLGITKCFPHNTKICLILLQNMGIVGSYLSCFLLDYQPLSDVLSIPNTRTTNDMHGVNPRGDGGDECLIIPPPPTF
jgi:hypothetical protein